MTVDPQARHRLVLQRPGESVERQGGPPEGPARQRRPRQDADLAEAADEREPGEREDGQRRDHLVVRGLPGGTDDEDGQADRRHHLRHDERGRHEQQAQ